MSCEHTGLSRRRFLSKSGKTIGVLAAAGIASSTNAKTPTPKSRIIGANERINAAVIGIRGRGQGHITELAELPNVCVRTICDIDERLWPDRIKLTESAQTVTPKTEFDLRRVIEDKDIDVISIATCNHWHSLATIWACQAGKHVYVEKPSSHNISESRKMLEAARKYDRFVQVGFDNRSVPQARQAMRLLREGIIGDIYMARGLCYKPRRSFGRAENSPVPPGVHYDLWLGPAPYRPFNEKRFHYNWHWHWDTGNGDIGNVGSHHLDIANWGLRKKNFPRKIRSFGGYFVHTDCSQETPNTQIAVYEYDDGTILQFEVRGMYTNQEVPLDGPLRGARNLFYGTKGWMAVRGHRWKTFFGRKNEPGPSYETMKPDQSPDDGNLMKNFINAIRAAKRSELASEIENGRKASVLAHLANISYRLGRDLTFDTKTEKFIADPDADKMLTRNYRKPYVVPENV